MNVEEIREYCLSKPGVTEGFPFNDTALVFKAVKIFAILDLSESRMAKLLPRTARPDVIRVKAKVAHIIMDSDRNREYVGVKFIDVDEEVKNKIKVFLRKLADKRREEILQHRRMKL